MAVESDVTSLARRRGRRLIAPVVVAGVCVAGVLGSFGQSSASPAPSVVAKAGHEVAAGPQTRLAAAGQARSSARLPGTKSLVSGVVGLATAARDTRSKVNVQIPVVDAVAYLDPAYRTPASQTAPAPKYYLPRHPVAGCRYTEGVLYTDLYAVHIKQPNPRKSGVVENVGRFPNAKVSALAFGSVPVTATLHSQQVKRHGKLLPLIANTVTGYISSDASGNSCDASWDSGAQTPPLDTISHGQLKVRISDVRVDKQLVDVGPSCHTVTPLHLNLFGSPGYIAYTGGQLTEQYDPKTVHSGASTYPLHPGSSNLTIPSFTGCVNPRTGEDFSKLITAMVSGPDNTVAVNQSNAVLNNISDKNVTVCLTGQGCVKRPAYVNPPRPGDTVRRRHH
jgi:hypothetical protein